MEADPGKRKQIVWEFERRVAEDRPVQGVGILLPGLVPAAVAALLALLFARGDAAPVAYTAGVAGPLIGADLMHLREIEQSAVGLASIGGAGTFDGIVLSGIVAAYLA